MNGRELSMFVENGLRNGGLTNAEYVAIARVLGAAAVFVDSTEPIIDLSDDAAYVELEDSVAALRRLLDPDSDPAAQYLKSLKDRKPSPGISHTHKDHE